MPHAIHAQPPLEFVPPNLKMGVVKAVSALVPLALKSRTSVSEVHSGHPERLAELFREFEAGNARFILAFRHPGQIDPLCIWYFISRIVPRSAREHGIALKKKPHAYFLYDRGVPLWLGRIVAWLLPRVGGISVQRGKLDRLSLKTARATLADGEYPLAIAPEGATNGLNDVVSPLEPGVAQLAFWCMQDLRAKGRTEKVYIVPLGVQYRYIDAPWEGIDSALATLEEECGLSHDSAGDRYERLIRIAEHLLTVLEEYYHRFYQQELTAAPGDLGARLHNLLEAALRTSEGFFAIQAKGSITDRCRRIEQAGWDRIYREDLKGRTISAVERGLADRVAEEADRRMWHMRIVEAFVAVTGSYVHDNPTADRFAETTNLLYTTMQRLKGTPWFAPAPLGKQRALLEVGDPILADDLYPAYAASRLGARQAVADLTQKLQNAMEAMTKPPAARGTVGDAASGHSSNASSP